MERLNLVFGLAVALTSLPIHLVKADTFYVAPDGNDSSAGSSARPWLTLRHAAQRAKPGDVVKVAAGVYHQTAVITRCHGTAKAPIVFEAHGGKVVLEGSVPVTGWRQEGGARYSAAVNNRQVYLVWADGRELLGPGFRFGSFDTVQPTTATLQRGQCLVEDGRVFVRLFDEGDPNKAEMRISVGHCLLLQNTQHTVWRGIGTAWTAGLTLALMSRERTALPAMYREYCRSNGRVRMAGGGYSLPPPARATGTGKRRHCGRAWPACGGARF